jgi:hypothetical protein
MKKFYNMASHGSGEVLNISSLIMMRINFMG